MPDRYLLAIPLAHGKSGNTGFLSIYFSPRLLESGPLSDYPDWDDWPLARGSLNFQVVVNGVVKPHTIVSAAPSSAKWLAIFPGTTPVEGFKVIDRTFTTLRTFDEDGFNQSVSDMYGRVAAAHPNDPPTVAALLADPTTNTFLNGNPNQSAFPGAQGYLDPIVAPTPGVAPKVDFHNALMNLGAHPELLRLLGVVVDVEVSLPASPANVRINTNYSGPPASGIARQIPVRMNTTSGFWMLPNPDPDNKEQVNGWTQLGDGDWDASQVDALAATQQLAGMSKDFGNPGASAALPALEDGGVGLMRANHATAIENLYVRRKQVENQIKNFIQTGNGGAELYAEDVNIGERIDIKDDVSKTFLSVFQRKSLGYTFPRDLTQNLAPAKDEGWNTFVLQSEQKETYELVTPGGPEDGPPIYKPTAVQRVRDTAFVWTGWSSVGPPPGKILDAEGNAIDPPPNKVTTSDEVQFESTYRPVAGTLPRLRYGRTYNFRARPVDLSGVSRTVTETHPASAESPPAFYGRGPVPPPAIVRSVNKSPLPGPGEYVTTVVLLSDYDTDVSRIATQYRMLLPPKTSQFRLELSGKLHGGIKPSDYEVLAERDARSTADECTIDPNSGDLVAKKSGSDVAKPVGYFPDPAGAGASFAGLPLTSKKPKVPFVGTWPDLRGIKLVFTASGRGYTVAKNKTGNTLSITVPKAFDRVVDVSCTIASSQLSKFGVVDLLSSDDQKALKSRILGGQHWMMSSRSGLRIVHAVRRPMTKPVILLLTAERSELNGLEVVIGGELDVHLGSTERTVLSATWEDPYDGLTLPEPETRPGAKILGSVVGEDVSLNPIFPDTKRHDIEVTAEAFSKFSSYFTEDKNITFTTATKTVDSRGLVDSSVYLIDPSNGNYYTRGVDFTVDAAEGEVTRVNTGAIASGATVKARFLRLPTSRLSTESDPEATFSIPIPASSAPTPPRVREVIPAFSFVQTKKKKSVTKSRSGQLLRVWIERPWYSSGPGELLGVMVDNSPGDVPGTTRYGRDPVVDGPGPSTPSTGDFPRASNTKGGVVTGLSVAGHDVVFDPDRQLWYSDIEIDADIGYRPFARLSVARFQPIAIDGAHVSTTVDLEQVRLGVARTSNVKKLASGDFAISLTGVAHDGIPDETNGGALLFNTAKVSFQKPFGGVTDPDLGWKTVQGPFNMTRTVLASGKTKWAIQGPISLRGPLRVLIEEYEPSMRSDGAGGATVALETVYVETFVLTAAFLNA